MATLHFTVKPTDGIAAYWIAVDDKDVKLRSGEGDIDVGPGEHVLVWWMEGKEGESVAITGARGSREVVSVKKSKIHAGRSTGSGNQPFVL